jgi:hypothetical protein
MKWIAVFVLLGLVDTAWAGSEILVRLDDPRTSTIAAVDNQIDLRFSAGFAKANGVKRDFHGVIVQSYDAEQICFEERGRDLIDLKTRLDGLTDRYSAGICLPRNEVWARVTPQVYPGASLVPFYHSSTAECHWRWVKGGGIGFWGEECRSDTQVQNYVYDSRSKEFSVRRNGKVSALGLRPFDVPASGGADALLARLKAAGEITNDKDCKLVPIDKNWARAGWSVWRLTLTGARAQAEVDDAHYSDSYSPYCGPLTVDWYGSDGRLSNLFMINDANPNRAYHVHVGHYGMLDPYSITIQ